jgi:uncharacterized low-complexity protein
MKKIITTLTAVTFALGLAAAAQAQVAKTPEKPAVQNTQAVQPQVAPKEAAKTVTTETVTTGDKTKEAAQCGDKGKVKKGARNPALPWTRPKRARSNSGPAETLSPSYPNRQPGLKKSPA